MDLGGTWAASPLGDGIRPEMADPALDDSSWEKLRVPGHWRSHPALSTCDGPVAYRRRFEAGRRDPGKRAFLVFEGIFYQSDVWLDGQYLGDTEGYFFPHSFEVTAALAERSEHLLALEVSCARPADLRAKRNLTGVYQHWDCIDPSWNPGGIWAPVSLVETGPLRIRRLQATCREATPELATLEIEACLETLSPAEATVVTTVRREGSADLAAETVESHSLAAGDNVFRWRVTVEHPELWWPWALGEQPLYELMVEVRAGRAGGGEPSDCRRLLTGLRQVRVRNFVAAVNGERLFLKGANYGPTNRAPAQIQPIELARDVSLAREAGLDLLRVHGHVARPELYEEADRAGMLLWQDLPLQWGYGQVRHQAVLQARQAVDLLGHHPSVALWCAHNEPIAVDLAPGKALTARTVARFVAGQVLPTWNKTILDRSVRRTLERADGSREVVAHSGVLPHPAWGTDTHLYFGWYHGKERDLPRMLARFPVLARFVSEFGAQALPCSVGFMRPERWPDLDWEDLEAHYCLQRGIFERRIPPSAYPSFEAWREATQRYQATVLRFHVETLRRLKYRPTGGFCMFMLSDAQPAVSWSVLDHDRLPKAGYHALAAACAPVIVVADRPAESYRPGEELAFDVHVVSDLRRPLAGAVARVELTWPGGRKSWRFCGEVPADSCVRVGRVVHQLPDNAPAGEIRLELVLRWELEGETPTGGGCTNSYLSRILA